MPDRFFEKSVIKDRYDYEKFGKILQSRIEIFSEIPEKVAFIDQYHFIDPIMYDNKNLKSMLVLRKKFFWKPFLF